MPIGDLLAEITGEKPTSPSSAPPHRIITAAGQKRKVEGESNNNNVPNKSIKQSHSASRDPNVRRPSPLPSRPAAATKATVSSITGQRSGGNSLTTSSQSKPYSGTSLPGRVIRKPDTLSALPSKKEKDMNDSSGRPALKSSTLSAQKIAPAKPSPTTPTSVGPAKAPKKGSFAEIMARGAKAQQIAPKAGVIQHKAIGQTTMSKKGRDEQKLKWKHGKATIDATSAANLPRDKYNAGARNGAEKDSRTSGKVTVKPASADNDVTGKKLKKAAMVSTGYTGTARPPPKKTQDSKNAKSGPSRGRPAGGLLAAPRTGRRDRYEDEDSDLDDFIDDDEDEDDVAPRGYRYADNYDSDSDMEAGADDIYMEEQKALRAARADDAREEALLEKLKREKEARKRRGY